MENQGIIRNPTQEELEQIQKKKLNTNVFKEEAPKQNQQTQSTAYGSVKMKPKASAFEPDPEPYRLITTNNIIKDNLTENHEIFVRRMSGKEDAILTNFGEASGEKILEGITQIIMNCTKTEMDLRQLPLNEKIPLFIFILAISLGKNFDAAPLKDCSTCDSTTNVVISIVDDFKTKYMEPNSPDYPASIALTSYPNAKLEATLELPKLGAENTFLKQGTSLTDYLDKMIQVIKEVNGTDSNGKKVTDREIPDIITYLNGEDKEKISKILNSWTEDYGVIYKTKITTCNNPNCCMKNKEYSFDPYEIIKTYVTRVITKQKKDF